MNIQMVDLMGQYKKISDEIDLNIIKSIRSGKLINGPIVKEFSSNLKKFLNVKHVIPCANGTDALQIAFMSLDLNIGDEIICPSWTYVATAEASAILGLKPVMCDVDINTFNITADLIEPLITDKTRVIVPVHLYGQSCDMEPILNLAKKYNLHVIEDNAQAIGCKYTFSDKTTKFTGTMGDIGTTSFYPSKNLGAYGDGGAIFTNDDLLAEKINLIANHGQNKKYHHKIIGCNSRLDSIQAEILNVKLKYLPDYNLSRNKMALKYDKFFKGIDAIKIPYRSKNSTHVFHQYTIIVENRDEFRKYMSECSIPTMIYYPIPLHRQDAYKNYFQKNIELTNTEFLSKHVISLPIHTEFESSNQDYIINSVLNFFK